MIISRTPFRVSFIGGGSDLKEYYASNRYGSVISTSIQKYMYIVIHPYFHDKIRLKYSITEDVRSVDEIKHPILRESIKKVNIDNGIEIASFADIPSGTGLGSSSSFTVGLLKALYEYEGISKSSNQLAKEACEIEINILKEPIGKQDQYAAAVGGLNQIKFYQNEKVEILPLDLSQRFIKEFESTFRLYYTGDKRSSSSILKEQKQNMKNEDKLSMLQKMVALTEDFKNALFKEDLNSVGKLLDYNWELKKQLASNISNKNIDLMYQEALRKGAIGGKLLGAGGAGFLMIMAFDHSPIENVLNCKSIGLKIEQSGTKIINSDKRF